MIGSGFLNKTLKVEATKERKYINWTLLKLNLLYIKGYSIKRVKREPTKRKKMFISHISGKDLIFRMFKELCNSTIKRLTTQLKNEQRTGINTYPRKRYKWPVSSRILNISSFWGSTNPTIREYLFAPIRMAIILLKRVMSIGKDVGKLENS